MAGQREELLTCPLLDCDWTHRRVAPAVGEQALASVFGLGVMAAVARAQELSEAERLVEQHKRSHTTDDYLRTVVELQNLVAGLTASIQEMSREMVR